MTITARRRGARLVCAAAVTLLLASGNANAVTLSGHGPGHHGGKGKAGKYFITEGETLSEVQAQAQAESQRLQIKDKGHTHKMADGSIMSGTTTDVVQGPTTLATSVGGSWNNYAFTIPSAPYAASSNGPSGAVHAVQLYNGKVLIMAGSGNQWENLTAKDFTSWLWDPTVVDQTKAWKFIPTPYDMFCAGHVELANGNVLITGGTVAYPQYDAKGVLVHDWDGSKQSYIFDVASERYVQTGSMTNARWYPTVLSVGGGKILVTGGLDDKAKSLGVVTHNTDTSELYDPATGSWTQVPTLDFSLSDPATKVAKGATNATRALPYYPGLVLLKGGTLFYSGESSGDNGVTPGLWNYKTGAYTPVQSLPYNYQRNAGATVLLPPAQDQKVMVMGGGDYSDPSIADTEIINLTTQSGAATWAKGPALSAAKMYVGAVILPDYTVFETNGASQFRANGVHTAEIYSPTSNKFTVMNSPTEDRLYHSNAFLEPTGQVAVMGSQPLDGSFNMHIAIYSPPYLYKTARPTVTGAATAFDYSGTAQGRYTIGLAAGTTIGKASLIRPSATTHSTDPDQRLVQLKVTKNVDGTYSFTPPTDDTLAPEGQYMLFVTDSAGVPSVARWVSLGAPLAGGGGATTPTPTPTPTPPPTTPAPTTPAPTTTAPTPTPTTTCAGSGCCCSSTPTPTPTPTATSTPAPTATPTATPSTLTLTKTAMSGWEATLSAQAAKAASGQDITLQYLSGSTWTYATNGLTDSSGKVVFTWGGGGTLSLRAVLGSTTSNTVSVTYGP